MPLPSCHFCLLYPLVPLGLWTGRYDWLFIRHTAKVGQRIVIFITTNEKYDSLTDTLPEDLKSPSRASGGLVCVLCDVIFSLRDNGPLSVSGLWSSAVLCVCKRDETVNLVLQAPAGRKKRSLGNLRGCQAPTVSHMSHKQNAEMLVLLLTSRLNQCYSLWLGTSAERQAPRTCPIWAEFLVEEQRGKSLTIRTLFF